MGYEIRIDPDECVSAGKCVASAPGFFEFDDDEIARVADRAEANAAGVDRPDDATLLRIARTCPSGAIHLTLDGAEVDL